MKKKDNLGFLISKINELNGEHVGNCIGPEDLALFIEGKLASEKREYISGHLAECERCYDAFLTASDIYGSEKRSFLMTIPFRAIAATLLVLFFSVYLFYRLNINTSDIMRERNKIKPVSEQFYKEKKAEKKEKTFIKPSIISKKSLEKEISGKKKPAPASKVAEQPGKAVAVFSGKSFLEIGEKVESEDEKEGRITGMEAVKKDKGLKSEQRDEDIMMRSMKGKTALKFKVSQPAKLQISIKIIPKIERVVDLKTAGQNITPGKVIAEFEINEDGSVKNIRLQNVDEGLRRLIKDSLKQWIFAVKGSADSRFKLNLKYDSMGKWVLKKINGRKSDADSD